MITAPPVTDHTLAVIALLIVIGGAVVGAILALSGHTRSSNWLYAGSFALLTLALLGILDDRDQRIAAAEQGRIVLNLNDHCPPRTDGLSDLVVMTLSTQADHGPELTSCARIAERGITRRPAP